MSGIVEGHELTDMRPQAGRMMAIVKPVIGQEPQALGLVRVDHVRRVGKGVDDSTHPVRGMFPYTVDQLLLRADVIGDVV